VEFGYNQLMSAALGLYRLQQVDSQMDQIQARLKMIRAILENDLELRTVTETVAAAESRHRETDRTLRQSEAEVEKQRIKIEQTESSLYGGQVHNPKELQDLQRDVVSLKRHLETLEERELEAMVSAEATEKELERTKEKLENLRSNLSRQNQDLVTESESLNRDLERLESERKAVMGDLVAPAIHTYNLLRQQKRGIAVAVISDSSCSACGTTLTASQQQSARSTSQLFNCPTCGRILYAN
jgi:predicted  nucleic acid-binding Zn-ribbon protein